MTVRAFVSRTIALGSVLAAVVLLSPAGAASAESSSPAPATTPSTPAASGSTPPPPGSVTFAVLPASSAGPDGRTTFTYKSIAAGTVIDDYVSINNFSDQAETFTIGADDAFTTPSGTLSLIADNQKSVDVGSWVVLNKTDVVVPAHARVNEPFKLTIPANAKPGDHTGGVFAEFKVGSGDSTAGGVGVDHRVAVPVFLQIPGKVTPAFTISSLSTNYKGTLNPIGEGSAQVTYTVTNSGNVNLAGTQHIAISGLYGITLASISGPEIPELLPGKSFVVKVTVPGVFPLAWMSTKVTINPVQTRANTGTATPPAIAKVTKSAGFWGTPILLIVLILLIGAGVWGGRRYFRRRQAIREDLLFDAVDRARREAVEQLTGSGPEAGNDGPTGRA